MKYNSQSAEVLNDSDRLERILDWQLFCNEQDRLLWGENPDVSWRPGQPVPMRVNNPHTMQDIDSEFWAWPGPVGNHQRPMIQTFMTVSYEEYEELHDSGDWFDYLDDRPYIYVNHRDPMDCPDCEVSWGFGEPECWVCGKYYEQKKSRLWDSVAFYRDTSVGVVSRVEETERGLVAYASFDGSLIQSNWVSYWREANENFIAGMRAAAESMNHFAEAFRGWSHSHVIYDENFEPMSYHPPSQQTERRGPLCPNSGYQVVSSNYFEQPEVVGPLWGTAALFDPLEARNLSYNLCRTVANTLPADWADMHPDVPLPEVPRPDLSHVQDRIDSGLRVRLNPNYYGSDQQISRRRRTRE